MHLLALILMFDSISPVSAAIPFFPVRLDSPGGSTETAPVYSQIAGTCYAYAAGVAIDTWRSELDPTARARLTNPFELALGHGQLEYGQARIQATVDGGSFCEVVRYAARAGICSQEVFPLVDDDGDRLKTLIKDLERLRERYRAIPFWRRKQAPATLMVEEIRRRVGEFGIYQGRDVPTPEAVHLALRKRKRAFIRTLVSDPLCESQRESVTHLERSCQSRFTHFDDVAEIIHEIDEALLSPLSRPVAVAYCSRVLREGRSYVGFSHHLKDLAFVDTKECGGHLSLVIGKRLSPQSGRRQFLIHNSWGTHCAPYSADWSCENGKVWVDADALAQNTYGLSWLR